MPESLYNCPALLGSLVGRLLIITTAPFIVNPSLTVTCAESGEAMFVTLNSSLIVTPVESSELILDPESLIAPATTAPVPEGVMFMSSFDLLPEMLFALICIPVVSMVVKVAVSMNAPAYVVPDAPKLYVLPVSPWMLCEVIVPLKVVAPIVLVPELVMFPVKFPVTSPVTSPITSPVIGPVNAVALIVPETSSFVVGVSVPIPTLDDEPSMVITVVVTPPSFTLNVISVSEVTFEIIAPVLSTVSARSLSAPTTTPPSPTTTKDPGEVENNSASLINNSTTKADIPTSNSSKKLIDAISNEGKRYSIKSTSTGMTSVFHSIELNGQGQDFEYLIILKFNNSYKVENILQLTWDKFVKHRKIKKPENRYAINISSEVIEDSEIL